MARSCSQRQILRLFSEYGKFAVLVQDVAVDSFLEMRSTRQLRQTRYFECVRLRPDRVMIVDAWLERAMSNPIREIIQSDGRVRRWCVIPEMNNRYLRVILLKDGETVHNAFFDRNFVP